MPLKAITYSGLRKADVCLRQWWALEYRGLRPNRTRPVGPLPFGSRVHLALEVWAKSHWEADVLVVWDWLMHRELVLDGKNGDFNAAALAKEAALGHAMLTGWKEFVETEGIDADWEILEIESKLSSEMVFTLGNGTEVVVKLRSKLDLVLRHKEFGTVWVFDYKTAQSVNADALALAVDTEQGPLYVIQMRRAADEQVHVAGFILGVLRKVKRGPTSKPPYFAWEQVPLSDEQVAAAEANITAKIARLVDIVDRLDNGEPHQLVVPYTTSWACRDCAFKLPCAEMRAGDFDSAEDMILGEFNTGDPLARYSEDDAIQQQILDMVV